MDDRELITKSQGGDTTAFNELVVRYRPKIFNHCLDVVKDEESAEDLTQEAFLRAYHHLRDFRQASGFYTWLYKIAHNLSLNHLRHKERKREAPLFGDVVENDHVAEEPSEELLMALERLSPKHRIVFEMYEFQRLKQKEIAEILGVPHGTVRSRLHYARTRLRKIMKFQRKA